VHKFEVNQTNLKRVILPAASSASSGDLRPDVRLTSDDVRPDVTTGLILGQLRDVTWCLLLLCTAVIVTASIARQGNPDPRIQIGMIRPIQLMHRLGSVLCERLVHE
jgi:hypothetical protein